jgi:hypothetical protein
MCQWSYESCAAGYSAIRQIRAGQAAGGNEEKIMKLHAPAMWIFAVSLIIVAVITVVAAIDLFTPIPYIALYGFWVAILAYVVLALGNVMNI